MFLDYFVLLLYALGMVGIAIYTRNRSKTVDDFLMAGKKGIGGLMSAFAYGTTYFSAVIFIGYAGNFGAKYGLAAVWIGIGNAILGSLVAWRVLARPTKNMAHRLDSKTMPQFFEKRYGSRGLKIVTAVVTFLFLIPYSASVYNGLGSLFETVFGIDGWLIMLALSALTALYLFFGGYFATALSDFIQGIIMLVGVAVMVVFFLASPQVSFDISTLVADAEHTWFTFGSEHTGFYGNTATLISLVLLTSFGVWALPQTVHKYHAVRDSKAIKLGTWVSTVFALIIGASAYFVGALSPLFDEVKGLSGDSIIPTMLKIVIPTGFIGLIAVLILSASMSTLSSVSLASASVVAVDIYKGAVNKKAPDKRVNTVMRLLCLFFVAISVIIAFLNEKYHISAIAYLMGLSWGTLAGCFIGPYVLCVLWKKVTKTAVWVSIISGLILTFVLIFVFGYFAPSSNGSLGNIIQYGVGCSPMIGVICMAFSMGITFIVSKFTKAPTEDIINCAFAKNATKSVVEE